MSETGLPELLDMTEPGIYVFVAASGVTPERAYCLGNGVTWELIADTALVFSDDEMTQCVAEINNAIAVVKVV